MNYNNLPQIRPTHEWVGETNVPGIILLRDPFTGVPFRGETLDQDPSTMVPPVFGTDEELGAGFWNLQRIGEESVWNGHQENLPEDAIDLKVNVLLTDPSSPEGLGNLDELANAMSQHDVIGYAISRSVHRGELQRRANPRVSGSTLVGDVLQEDPYTQKLMEVAKSVGKNLVFKYDPQTDAVGEPTTRGGRNLRKVEDAVRTHMLEQGTDLNDPDAAFVALDGVYSIMLAKLHASRASLELDDLSSRVGCYPGSALLLEPAELFGLPAAIHSSGIDGKAIYVGPERDRKDYAAYMTMATEAYVDAR